MSSEAPVWERALPVGQPCPGPSSRDSHFWPFLNKVPTRLRVTGNHTEVMPRRNRTDSNMASISPSLQVWRHLFSLKWNVEIWVYLDVLSVGLGWPQHLMGERGQCWTTFTELWIVISGRTAFPHTTAGCSIWIIGK